MEKIRWGLCCIFRETPIKYYSTTVAHIAKLKAKQEDHLEFLGKIILKNLQSLLDTIDYCQTHGIGSFRVNSQFLPIYCHQEHGFRLDQMPDSAEILRLFAECKNLAAVKNIRLSFHPDHFVVLNSPDENIVQNSLRELEYHGEIAELLGADVINIHAGGVYGDKSSALERFAQNFTRLSKKVQARLTIENDDRSYTPKDLLPLCRRLQIPLVYDVHHHRCLPDQLSIEETSDLSYETWNREPLFHLSSPLEGWNGPRPQRHHDFIQFVDFPLTWLKYTALTVDVEAKAKESAVLKVIADFKALRTSS